jgi:hypothetical protein
VTFVFKVRRFEVFNTLEEERKILPWLFSYVQFLNVNGGGRRPVRLSAAWAKKEMRPKKENRWKEKKSGDGGLGRPSWAGRPSWVVFFYLFIFCLFFCFLL